MSSRLYHEKGWLEEKYHEEGWSQTEIAEFCGVTQSTIYKWMKKFDIKTRDASECHIGRHNGAWVESPVKDYQWMYEQYVKKKKSLRNLAKEGGVALRTVARWMDKHGIERRQGSEAIIEDRSGKNHPNYEGAKICPICGGEMSYGSEKCQQCHFEKVMADPEKNSNYKGISSFTELLRGYSKREWRPKVLERDNHECVECGEDDNTLYAHHIVPFSVLRDQIVMDHINQIDLTDEDGQTKLYKKAKKDTRINDIENGVTLCEDCHKGEHRRKRLHKDDLIYTYYATVLEVLDGDSVLMDIDLGFECSKRTEVRLFGVDAPELNSQDIHQEGKGLQAKKALKTLCVPGREVVIRTYKTGKYGRWLALLILDGSNFNRFLVSSDMSDQYFGD